MRRAADDDSGVTDFQAEHLSGQPSRDVRADSRDISANDPGDPPGMVHR